MPAEKARHTQWRSYADFPHPEIDGSEDFNRPSTITAEYDVSPDAWFFSDRDDGNIRFPF